MKGFKFQLVARLVSDLILNDGRPRKHSEAQIAQISESMKEFGFTNPVLIDERNVVIAGFARILASMKIGTDTVPCIVLVGLSEAQKAAYAIADNKLALNAGWDEELLYAELARIADLDFDINLTGFSEVEILALPGANDTKVIDVITGPDGTPSGEAESRDPGDPKTPDWSGMPDFDQREAGPFRTLLVHFKDQEAVDAFAKLLGQKLTDKTKYVWYPQQVKVAAPGVVYV